MTLDVNVALAGYLLACLVVAVVVHAFRFFDQRALAADLDERLRPLSFFDRPDRGLIVVVVGFLSLLAAAYLGWRLPADIQRMVMEGETALFASEVARGSLARGAQVVGAVCFALVALRLLRFSLILTFACTMLFLAIAAYTYVFA